MKILFLAPANSIHTVRWVNELSKKNEVLLVSLSNHKVQDDIIEPRVKIKYLPISGIMGYYFNALILRHIVAKFVPDIVHVHYASGYGTLARVSHIPKIVLSVWGSDVYDFPYHNRLCMKLIQKNLHYASYIISTSKAMGIQVEKIYPQVKCIDIVPFGVDIHKFKYNQKKGENNKFIFCVVKSLEDIYGIDVIVKSFSFFLRKIKNDKQKIELHIYGKGTKEEQLKRLSIEEKCEDHVKWKGYVKNTCLPEILSEADVFCVGSRKESFGVSTVEAMAAGVPVLATETDGAKEIIINNVTGLLVKQEAVEEMSKEMRFLYDNVEKRRAMGKAGRDRVKEFYNWEKNVETMLKIYKKITEE